MKKLMLVVALVVALMTGCGQGNDDLVGSLTVTGEAIGDAMTLMDKVGDAVGSDIACTDC
jgi:hypothetical protein